MENASSKLLNNIIVVGRDAAVWLSALALHGALNKNNVKVVVITLPSLLSDKDIYVSRPPLEGLHKILGLSEWSLLRDTDGLFSLGTFYQGFARSGSEFFHPYSQHGFAFNNIPFIDLWCYAHSQGLNAPFDYFSLNSAAARTLKFFKPDEETSALHNCDYVYHLNARKYVNALAKKAADQGIESVSCQKLRLNIDVLSGYVRSLSVDDHTEIDGDLFIDASGEEALLLTRAAQEPRHCWRNHFPFTKKIMLQDDKKNQLPPYSELKASNAGIFNLVALRNSTSISFSYNPSHLSQEIALKAALISSNSDRTPEIIDDESRPGYLTPWRCNVIGIGNSVCSTDVTHPELQLIHSGIIYLLMSLPLNRSMQECRSEYNRKMLSFFEEIRDFAFIKYRFNRMFDESIWQSINKQTCSEPLQHLIDRYKKSKSLNIGEDAIYQSSDWYAQFVGFKLLTETLNPALQTINDTTIIRHLQKTLDEINEKAGNMASLDIFMEDI